MPRLFQSTKEGYSHVVAARGSHVVASRGVDSKYPYVIRLVLRQKYLGPVVSTYYSNYRQ